LARNPLPEVLCGKALCEDVKSTCKIKDLVYFKEHLQEFQNMMVACLVA